MRPWRSAALILATSFALVAVPRAAYPAPTDPCSLPSQAQVGAALGVSVSAGKASGNTICRWAGPDGHPGANPALVVTIQDAKAFEFAKSPSKSATLVKGAAGGGDDSSINMIGTMTAILTVKKGDTYFELHVYGLPIDHTKTVETTLGKEVVANLK